VVQDTEPNWQSGSVPWIQCFTWGGREFPYVPLQMCQRDSSLPCIDSHKGAFSAAGCGVRGITLLRC
jgi:hypothetical protein